MKLHYRILPAAYQVALRNGWLSEMIWFEEGKRANGYWNIKENVFEEAKKYQTRTEFCKGCGGAYQIARRNGWLDEMIWFKHRKCTQETRKKMSIANINHPNKSKPIFQINKDTNEIITKFPSASEAQRQLGISFKHISLCCLGKQKTCGGYKWRFAS